MGSFHAVRAGSGLQATVPIAALFFGVWQTWTLVALSISERDALDLRRFLVYPIPPRRVFAYGLVASLAVDPFAAFWCLLLAGTFAGAAVARPGPWLVLLAAVLAAFVAATVVLVALLQELLARLLRGRRARELLVATVYVGAAALLASTAGHPGVILRILRGARALRWLAYPAALAEGAVRELYAGRALAALPWIAALAGACAASAWAAYRLALSGRPRRQRRRATRGGHGRWRLAAPGARRGARREGGEVRPPPSARDGARARPASLRGARRVEDPAPRCRRTRARSCGCCRCWGSRCTRTWPRRSSG